MKAALFLCYAILLSTSVQARQYRYIWDSPSDPHEVADFVVTDDFGGDGPIIPVFTTGVQKAGQSCLEIKQYLDNSVSVWHFTGLPPNEPIWVSMDINLDLTSTDAGSGLGTRAVQLFWRGGLYNASDPETTSEIKENWFYNGTTEEGNGKSTNGWVSLMDNTEEADSEGNFTVAVKITNGQWQYQGNHFIYLDNMIVGQPSSAKSWMLYR